MYVPLYKVVALEISVLGSQSKPATDCVFGCVGELPSFGDCKELQDFYCNTNKFTGIVFSQLYVPLYSWQTDTVLHRDDEI